MSIRHESVAARVIREYSFRLASIEVQRLTREQMVGIGLLACIPDEETRIIAIGRNKNGDKLLGRVMEGVDDFKFLHGEDEYYDQVLKQAKELLNSKIKLE